jgi:hypothetical protein
MAKKREETKKCMLNEEKRHRPSVKRLKLERERRVEQGDKDYARAHTLSLTGDAHTKNRRMKERNLSARLTFTFFFFYPLTVYAVCLYLNKKRIHRKSKEKTKKEKI